MKLVSYESKQASLAGVLLDSGVLDIGRLSEQLDIGEAFPAEMKSLLASGRLDELMQLVGKIVADSSLQDKLRSAGILVDTAAVRLLAPIHRPGLIVSSGGAYRDHLEEMDVGDHDDPMGFIKSSAAVCGTGDDIVIPRAAPDMVDWEAEFSCVFGKVCHDVTPEEALDYVAGYTLINDVSARDGVAAFLTPSDSPPLEVFNRGSFTVLGKQFPTFCPMGPYIVTKDELTDPSNVDLQTTVNGKVMQSANTSGLIHTLQQTISYFSRFYRFEPGDVLTTGSPSGVGFAQKPPVFLKAGDVVEVSSPQIGVLRNVVSGPA